MGNNHCIPARYRNKKDRSQKFDEPASNEDKRGHISVWFFASGSAGELANYMPGRYTRSLFGSTEWVFFRIVKIFYGHNFHGWLGVDGQPM